MGLRFLLVIGIICSLLAFFGCDACKRECPKDAKCVCGKNGHIKTAEWDKNGDGKVDKRNYYYYDGKGGRRWWASDDNMDGKIDYKCNYIGSCPPPYKACGMDCQELKKMTR